ncbi:centrosomal protein of 57 kDa-like isoform X1 [Saccostrea echinata]|uniref:centrosomal protein of 57 kDa-like isoform X1 n=1 Tax=Saccostrea echinata TaxID=191078 RepID=UPI002A7F2605|nr:centrosomal protein of 57 kDa-like isoform X1 [Saccostrea echinata]
MPVFTIKDLVEATQVQTFSPHILGGKSPTKRPLYRNQEESVNLTAYHDYPTKPFINDDYRFDPAKPVKPFPENNRTAVISALKNLQEKIRKLEVERGTAENNLKSLAAETTKYKNILQKEPQNTPGQSTVSKNTQELETQLTAAETRSQLLEKQLDYMRRMVQTAENDRQEAVIKAAVTDRVDKVIQPSPQPGPSPEYLRQREKLMELEREHLRLTASQTLSENKIRELEEKLQEERHRRRLMEDKTVEQESLAESARILRNAESIDRLTQKAKKTKKRRKASANKKQKQAPPTDHSKHYRLNLADIPFVAGKSLTASHSVGANVQRVLSLMKSHNMALCNGMDHHSRSSSPSSGSSSSGSIDTDLAELLLQLQDEFGQMSCEHQELSHEISEATDPQIREDLERELDALVTRMESKSQQISKIRRHQNKIDQKKKKKKTVDPSKRRSASANAYSHQNGEVEVTTTIKTRGRSAGVVHVQPTNAREVSLNVLKDMKKLQTTLRKDDLAWE